MYMPCSTYTYNKNFARKNAIINLIGLKRAKYEKICNKFTAFVITVLKYLAPHLYKSV